MQQIRESYVARPSQTRDQASLARVYAIAPSFIFLSGLPFPAQPYPTAVSRDMPPGLPPLSSQSTLRSRPIQTRMNV